MRLLNFAAPSEPFPKLNQRGTDEIARYLEALRWANAYRKLIVTGSQRSGTTICAQMLSVDLRWEYFDETVVDLASIDKVARLMRDREKFVLQMPSLLRKADDIAEWLGDGEGSVIVMRRPYREVEASRRRIGLRPRENVDRCLRQDLVERAHSVGYPLPSPQTFLTRKLSLMEFRQIYISHYLQHLPHFFVLDYSDLTGHPLYVAPEFRRSFRPKQTMK